MRLLLILMMLVSFLSFAPNALADTSCNPVYGGGQSCTTTGVSIEKDVVNPQTNSDVHNLGTDGPMFAPGQTVTFHITVHNNGSTTINNATITDIFPQFINFDAGPGTFDPNDRQLTFTIGNLLPGTSQTFTVTGTVNGSQLEQNQPTCVANQASVTVDNQSAQDSAQFCMTPGQAVLSASTGPVAPQMISSPATGASGLVLASLLPIGLVGFYISKQTKGGLHA